jgi:hypothetical protein
MKSENGRKRQEIYILYKKPAMRRRKCRKCNSSLNRREQAIQKMIAIY